MKTEHGENFLALLRGEVSQSRVWKPVKIDRRTLRIGGLLRSSWPEFLGVLLSRRPGGSRRRRLVQQGLRTGTTHGSPVSP